MGIGSSIFLIAVGAILTFAVHATVAGLSIQTVGIILMLVGALGVALFLTVFGPRRTAVASSPDVVEGGTVVRERTVY